MLTRFLLAAVSAAGLLLAQLDTGSVNGTITDPSGAAVSAAQVTLRNEATGATRTAVSNEQGYFVFPAVSSGHYTLQTQVPGFKAYERTGIVLQVNQHITAPIVLELGESTEKVTVTASAAVVETTSGTIRETVDEVRVSELPLNGRNVLQLQSLLPGAVPVGSLDQGANTPGYAINGATGASNNYSLDGAPHQDGYFNAPLPFPNPDAIQEFTVQTNSYSAEFGRNRGASINAVTKSGTNSFHGGLFEFVRNDVFDARPFFATEAPAFKRNQFGAQLGGPIKRNQTFFFFAWQATHERGTPNTSTALTPTTRMRAGDFSELAKTLTDPLTQQPFPNNQIPISRLNQPVLRFMEQYVPLPNSKGLEYVTPRNRPLDGNQYTGRIDHAFSNNDRLYGRYLFQEDDVFNPGGNFEGWGIDQNFRRQSLVLNETHIFSPSVLNTFSATFNRVKAFIVPVPDFAWSEFGANIPPAAPQIYGWHVFNVAGYFQAANGTFWNLGRNTFSFDDTVSWNTGRHSLKFGAQIARYQVNQLNEYLTRGNFQFTGFASGDALADAMLGRVANLRQVSPLGNTLRQTLWHFFIADDIKVSKQLTLNIGLRWEPNLNFVERDGKLSMFHPGEQSTVYPGAPPGPLFQGDPQLREKVLPNHWKNFAPRFGFAYDLTGDGKTAIRGGYGIFWDTIRTINLNRFPLIQPFVIDSTVFDVDFSNPYGGASFFPFTPPSTPEQKRDFRFVTPAAHTAFNDDFRTPYTQQWNLNIQRQLPKDIVITAAYIGSKSSRLFGSHNINPAVFGPGATVANTQSRRLYPNFGTIEDESTFGWSQYHSFQLTVNKRMSHGLTILGSYTISKNTGLTSAQSEGSLGTRDPWNRALDRGPLNEDRPQILTISGVWHMPSPFRQGIGKAIFGGWEWTGILSAIGGSPLTVRAGVDRSLNGQGLDTADVVGDWRLSGNRSRQEKLDAWFDATAFVLPAIGTVGTSSINMLRGPGQLNIDAGLYRNFGVREKFNIQFRAEFFNVLNHTRLGNPNTNRSSSAFGRILGTLDPRVGELALKFQF